MWADTNMLQFSLHGQFEWQWKPQFPYQDKKSDIFKAIKNFMCKTERMKHVMQKLELDVSGALHLMEITEKIS